MYAATKHAISQITESLNTELAGTGVRIVAIESGFFATELYADHKRVTITPSSHYAPALTHVDAAIATGIASGADPSLVADAILEAVDNPHSPARVLVGTDALARWDAFRRELIDQWRAELDAT